jgi:hypothetical protein
MHGGRNRLIALIGQIHEFTWSKTSSRSIKTRVRPITFFCTPSAPHHSLLPSSPRISRGVKFFARTIYFSDAAEP